MIGAEGSTGPTPEELQAAEAAVHDLLPLTRIIVDSLDGMPFGKELRGKVLQTALGIAANDKSAGADKDTSGSDNPGNLGVSGAETATNSQTVQDRPTPPQQRANSEAPKGQISKYEINPGQLDSFLIGPNDIPLARKDTSEGAPRGFIAGVVAIIEPVLGRSSNSLVDPDAPSTLHMGPRIFISDVTQMRHGDSKILLQETAEHLSEADGGPVEYYLGEIEKNPFKVVVSSQEPLDNSEWSPENSCLLVNGSEGSTMSAIYPYLTASGSAENGGFDLRFSTEGIPTLIQGERWPLGTIALSNNLVVTAPYEEISFVGGGNNYPQFVVIAPQRRQELSEDLADEFEQASNKRFQIKITDTDIETNIPAAAEVVVEAPVEAEAAAVRPFSIVGDTEQQRGRRGLGVRRRSNEPQTILVRGAQNS